MPSGGSRPGAGRPRKSTVFERDSFTEKQLEELSKSPHVVCVTPKTISYTLAFKELLWTRYCAGETPENIFKASGLDPDILGSTRIWGQITTLRRLHEKDKPFVEGRAVANTEPKPEPMFEIPKPPRGAYRRKHEEDIRYEDVQKLMHQVAYLSQQMEFLKKIISAGKDGRS